MLSPVHLILRSRLPDIYAYENIPAVEVEESAECFVCQEPYYTSDGCRPIRRTHCGHGIGHECFVKRTSRLPETRPYCNHHLPSSHDNDRFASILGWIRNTHLCRMHDVAVYTFPFIRIHPANYTCLPIQNAIIACWIIWDVSFVAVSVLSQPFLIFLFARRVCHHLGGDFIRPRLGCSGPDSWGGFTACPTI
jgi:hypothetical protein